MATVVQTARVGARRETFWLFGAIAMAAVLVAGFSIQLALGRSTFAVPLHVHAHALLFFGWTTFYVLQTALADSANMALHRRLGWLSVGWIPAMVVMGTFVSIDMVRRGAAPFFFQPLYFLMMNPLSIFAFAGLAGAAIVKRRQTQWHRRLLFCAMAVLTGPGFGRLLPMPFLIPYAGWAVFVAVMIFPIAGVIRDLKRRGSVHPAWWWGIGTIVVMQILMDVLTGSALGLSLYQSVTAGSAGAAVPPLAYPPFPPM